MILYASTISYDSLEQNKFTLQQEIAKCTLDVTEAVFLFMAIRDKTSYTKDEIVPRILNVALTWSFFECIFSYLFYFAYNATGEEFNWEYIQTALNANVDMYERISLVTFLEIFNALMELNKFKVHILILILAKFFAPIAVSHLIIFVPLEEAWRDLTVRAAFAVFYSSLAM